jgi:hypothetical protein
MRAAAIFLFALLLSGCGRTTTHVAGLFYLTYFENPDEMLLFRCPNGPDEGCAGESFPDATVFAAGASEKYIVLARHPYNDKDRSLDRDRTEYFYFARVKEEFRGWGDNPEKVIGPLNGVEFLGAKSRYHLPNFSIHLSDLE